MAARALVRSIMLSGTQADVVVLHTGAVTTDQLAPLRELGARLVLAEHLPTSAEFNARHQRERIHAVSPFLKGGKPLFHTPLDNFIKLRLWQLEQYRCCLLYTSDAADD